MRGKARTIIIIVLLLLAVAGCIFLLGRGLGRAEAAERPPSIKQELITLLSESTLAHRVREWFSVGMEYEKATSGESVSVRDLTSRACRLLRYCSTTCSISARQVPPDRSSRL